MTSLPLINKKIMDKKEKNYEFLRFSNNSSLPQIEKANLPLKKETLKNILNKRYLYIDFQTKNHLLQLEKDTNTFNQEEQSQNIGENIIGGFESLQKVHPQAYSMHKFLSEEKLDYHKIFKWRKILKKVRGNQPLVSFSKMSEKINPQKLQDFLQDKHNENVWKSIQQKEERLYQNLTSNRQHPIFEQFYQKIFEKQKQQQRPCYKGKLKLKALTKLNELLKK